MTGTTSVDATSRGYSGLRCPAGAVDLDELREVRAIFQGVHDGRFVGRETVRRDLERIRSGRMAKALNEKRPWLLGCGVQREVENKFGVPLDADKTIASPRPSSLASSGDL